MRLSSPGTALTLAVVLVLGVVTTYSAQAQTFTVLYNFTGGADGGNPYAGLLRDTAGNLYGTTTVGGSSNNGTVFKLNTSGAESILHSFHGADGQYPYAGVIMDAKGNLYGTTANGGTGCSGTGCGTVFKLTPRAGGRWAETVLHKFTADPDGAYPFSLIQDAKGNLYGATEIGGANAIFGTVFKVSKAGKETVLHSFAGSPSDGAFPNLASLLMDTKGNLYGNTFEGGDTQSAGGAVYKLGKSGVVTVLHSFGNGTDGFEAVGTPIMDKQGNLYGTTYTGGSNANGSVWKVSARGKETVLHSFVGGASDGKYPYSGVILDTKGSLYGVTTEGGASTNGVVYELSAKGVLTVLHSFAGSDGAFPAGGLIMDAKGNLYGTTVNGGSNGSGTVWKLTP